MVSVCHLASSDRWSGKSLLFISRRASCLDDVIRCIQLYNQQVVNSLGNLTCSDKSTQHGNERHFNSAHSRSLLQRAYTDKDGAFRKARFGALGNAWVRHSP